MKINKLEITISILLTTICFSGCGQSTETTTSNTNRVNRETATANIVNQTDNSTSPAISTNSNPAINAAQNVTNSVPTVKSNRPPVKMPTPNIGSGGNDFALLTKARGAISVDKDLLNSVIIEVKDGVATFTGKVSSEAQKQKAEELVRGVEGIKSIKNNLRVGA